MTPEERIEEMKDVSQRLNSKLTFFMVTMGASIEAHADDDLILDQEARWGLTYLIIDMKKMVDEIESGLAAVTEKKE